jgi:hypothetical protein
LQQGAEEDETTPLSREEMRNLLEQMAELLQQTAEPHDDETSSIDTRDDETSSIDTREIEEENRRANERLQALANEIQETGNQTLIQKGEFVIKLIEISINASNPLEIVGLFAEMNFLKLETVTNRVLYLGVITELTRALQTVDRPKLIALGERLKESSDPTKKEFGCSIERRAETISAPLILTSKQEHLLYKLEQDLREVKILDSLTCPMNSRGLIRKTIEEMRNNNQLYLFEKPENAKKILEFINSSKNPQEMFACFEGIDLFSPLPREEQLSAHSRLIERITFVMLRTTPSNRLLRLINDSEGGAERFFLNIHSEPVRIIALNEFINSIPNQTRGRQVQLKNIKEIRDRYEIEILIRAITHNNYNNIDRLITDLKNQNRLSLLECPEFAEKIIRCMLENPSPMFGLSRESGLNLLFGRTEVPRELKTFYRFKFNEIVERAIPAQAQSTTNPNIPRP